MKCLIVQDCCPFHLALYGKHSCQGCVQLSDGPLALRAAATSAAESSPCLTPRLTLGPTRPTSITPNPDTLPKGGTIPAFIHPEGFFFFLNAPDCYCLRCNWACKNIKAQTAWHVMKWERQRAERKRRLTQHLKGKMRRRKGEEIKQQSKRT